jgi:hypothetical protein
MGWYFRNPRTTQELRNVAGLDADKREHREDSGVMITSWDDLPIAARENRNWKRFRRTKWRA